MNTKYSPVVYMGFTVAKASIHGEAEDVPEFIKEVVPPPGGT